MDAGGEAEEGLEGGHWGMSAVEAEGELVEVGLEVIVADAVVGPAEPGLEVTKDAMDVRQELRRPLGGALRARAMAVAEFRERGIGLPPVRQDEGTGTTVRFTKPVNERAEASGTTWSRTRPAAGPRTSTAPTISALSSS
jgi:hypothetical protein